MFYYLYSSFKLTKNKNVNGDVERALFWLTHSLKWVWIKQNACPEHLSCLCRMEELSWTIPAPWLSMRADYCGPTNPSSVCCPLAPVAMTTPGEDLPPPPAWGPKSATWSAVLQTRKECTPSWMNCWLQTCTSASTPCWVRWCPWTRVGHGPWTSCRETPRTTWTETGPNWPGSVWCSGQSAQPLAELRTGWVRGPGRWSRDGCE